MHYYQFHIGDYQRDTAHLDDMEDLAYRRMLDLYYKEEEPLPLDIKRLAKLIRMRTHCECIANVLHEYFERTENGWVNHRAEQDLAEIMVKSAKAKAAAEARWAKKTKQKQSLNANALQTQCKRNADGMLPITHNPIPKTNNTFSKAPHPSGYVAEGEYFMPTNRYDTQGETYPVTKKQIDNWRKLYPNVEVDSEIRKMIGWLDGNPSKRKTMQGMKRFANNWLAKAQDQGGQKSGSILGSSDW